MSNGGCHLSSGSSRAHGFPAWSDAGRLPPGHQRGCHCRKPPASVCRSARPWNTWTPAPTRGWGCCSEQMSHRGRQSYRTPWRSRPWFPGGWRADGSRAGWTAWAGLQLQAESTGAAGGEEDGRPWLHRQLWRRNNVSISFTLWTHACVWNWG